MPHSCLSIGIFHNVAVVESFIMFKPAFPVLILKLIRIEQKRRIIGILLNDLSRNSDYDRFEYAGETNTVHGHCTIDGGVAVVDSNTSRQVTALGSEERGRGIYKNFYWITGCIRTKLVLDRAKNRYI